MWLLHTTTYDLKEFSAAPASYAILSHRWEDHEVNFADLQERSWLPMWARMVWRPKGTKEASWRKIQSACELARSADYEWIWLDMCCIDKTSSAELQEALNSMFALYRDANICFAYLKDVHAGGKDPKTEGSEFRASVWFTRGWTLQELIAPAASRLVFLYADWTRIGTRTELAPTISEITSIDRKLLEMNPKGLERLDFSRWSVAARMSWASNRETTRPEDKAYSLAGLFDVSMPVIYGEGGEKAFWRLQLEIIGQSPDQSIFAWRSHVTLRHLPPSCTSTSPLGGHNFGAYTDDWGLLASSTSDFRGCSEVITAPIHNLTTALGLQPLTEPHFSCTNHGIRIQLPLRLTRHPNIFLGALACQDSSSRNWQALALRQVDGGQTYVRIECPDSGIEQSRVIELAQYISEGPLLSSLPGPHMWKVQTIYIRWQATEDVSNMHLGYDSSRLIRDARAAANKIEGLATPQCLHEERIDECVVDDLHQTVSAVLNVFVDNWPIYSHLRSAYEITQNAKSVEQPCLHRPAMYLRVAQAWLICSFIRTTLRLQDEAKPRRLNHSEPEKRAVTPHQVEIIIMKLGNVIEVCTLETREGYAARLQGWEGTLRQCESELEELGEGISTLIVDEGSMDQGRKLQSCNIASNFVSMARSSLSGDSASLGSSTGAPSGSMKLTELATAALIATKVDGVEPNCRDSLGASLGTAQYIPLERVLQKNWTAFEFRVYHAPKIGRKHYQDPTTLVHGRKGLSHVHASQWERVVNSDIGSIWKEMGWGSSIDGHTFALCVYNYFVHLESWGGTEQPQAGTAAPLPPHSDRISPTAKTNICQTASPADHDASTSESHNRFQGCTANASAAQDAWCINYFHKHTLSTFQEVLDGDMNGLINVRDVNKFTSAKPGWITLMQWIAYNAYGWRISAHIYRLRIEWMVERIATLDYAKENSAVVAACLDRIPRVTAYLRTLGEPDLPGPQFCEVIHSIMVKQEQMERATLERLKYVLEKNIWMMLGLDESSPWIGRIEERILCALFLVMQRFCGGLSVATECVLEEDVLRQAASGIDCLVEVLEDRTIWLRKRLSEMHCNVDREFQLIANGMFYHRHRFLSSSDAEERRKMEIQCSMPWRSEQVVVSGLREYDPKFNLELQPVLSFTSRRLVRGLVRSASSLSGEPDEGYELVAFYRVRYGIILDPAYVAERPVDTSTSQEHTQAWGIPDAILRVPSEHSGTQCHGCMIYPLIGTRFKCIDCGDFDYCSKCHGTSPPPLLHPKATAGSHTAAHRFLSIEQEISKYDLDSVLRSLRTQPRRASDSVKLQGVSELDPLIAHCLSQPSDVVQQVVRACSAYRRHCLHAVAYGSWVADSSRKALDAVLDDLAFLPEAIGFLKSRTPLYLRMRDGAAPEHFGVHCDGCDGRTRSYSGIIGGRYKCVDCDDFNFCSKCFDAYHSRHSHGKHRFLLVPYPVASFVLQRAVASYESLTTGVITNPSKSEEHLSREVSSSEDHMTNADSLEGTDNDHLCALEALEALHRYCRTCQHPIPKEKHMFKCLTCIHTGPSEGTYYHLCFDCVYAKPRTAQDGHKPTHIIAVIPREDEIPEEPTRPPEPGSNEPQPIEPKPVEPRHDESHRALPQAEYLVRQQPDKPRELDDNPAAGEDLAGRVKNLEETIRSLQSLIDKLQGPVPIVAATS